MAVESPGSAPPARWAPRLTGGLLVVAAVVLATSAVDGVPAVVETVGFVLVASASCALVDTALAGRRFGVVLLPLALLATGDRLAEHAASVGRAWAVSAALGGYVIWRGVTGTPRRVAARAVPVLVAVTAPMALRFPVSDAALAAVSIGLVIAAAAAAAIIPARAARAAAALLRNQADLDAVLLANLELRNLGDADAAAGRIARIATELLDAEGATVWLRGPGPMLCAGGHGVTPPPEREVIDGSIVDRVLATGTVEVDETELVLPLTASGGVFGAIVVNRPRRGTTSFVDSVLHVFGAQAGYALERLRALESLIDARYVDPVTGVGNRLAATSTLATMRPGDAVILVSVDGLERIRATEGEERADLVLGQIGLHLRTATRAGDLVARFDDGVFFVMLRDLSSSAESVVTRLLESWQDAGTAGPLHAGAAIHLADSTPLDTLDRATSALDEAFDDRDPISIAAERAIWGPAS
jgi:GGDEF domain-containing protein